VPLAPVDLAKGEQHSDAYRAINPRRVVPTLVLEDGTAIGEVLAIWRYFEEVYPTPPLLGSMPKDKAPSGRNRLLPRRAHEALARRAW
jgi:glutathione S-transferase